MSGARPDEQTPGPEPWVFQPAPDLERSVAERLRGRIEGEPFPFDEDGGKTLPVTISAGVASWNPSATSASDLIDRADQALCEAKQAGRNRICVHRREPRRG